MPDAKPVILILGPTAGGKTELAIELALRLPAPGTGSGTGGECISADSMQVYRGMDIGTAKPTAQQRSRVSHHLIDIVDPSDDSFSVDRWLQLAKHTIADVRSRGRYPIVVGGTNLYVQALLKGMASGPGPDEALRKRLNEMELPQLRSWLERIDSAAAQAIHPNDRKRTIRAIEVFEQTGQPLSQMQQHWGRQATSQAVVDSNLEPIFILGLDYPVAVINSRINSRVKSMMEVGFAEEVRHLHQSGSLGRNAREALGYKQMLDHLEGRCTLEEAIEQIKIKTRRYAKQQRTWFRRFRHDLTTNSLWIDASSLELQQIVDKALIAIREVAELTCHSQCATVESADE